MSKSIILPWAVLCPDNQRHGLMRGRIVLTKRYRAALEHASIFAAMQCRNHKMYECRVKVDVSFYEPDNRRRDLINYAKLVHDALTGSAYKDDSLIWRVTWARHGVDKENPRVEVVVKPITPMEK